MRTFKVIVCRDRETGKPTGETVVLTKYAGKTIKGVARCNPSDTYNEQFGIDLAGARCELALAKARCDRACTSYNMATVKLAMAQEDYERAMRSFTEADDACEQAEKNLESLLSCNS